MQSSLSNVGARQKTPAFTLGFLAHHGSNAFLPNNHGFTEDFTQPGQPCHSFDGVFTVERFRPGFTCAARFASKDPKNSCRPITPSCLPNPQSNWHMIPDQYKWARPGVMVSYYAPKPLGIQSYRTSGSVRLGPTQAPTCLSVEHITKPDKVRLDPYGTAGPGSVVQAARQPLRPPKVPSTSRPRHPRHP